MLAGVAVHHELAELIAAAGREILDEPEEFRAALDDFFAESAATTGELSLLVDAVRLGNFARFVDQINLGADSALAVQDQGDRLAWARGTQESGGARWALAALGYALGEVADEQVSALHEDMATVDRPLSAEAAAAGTGPPAEVTIAGGSDLGAAVDEAAVQPSATVTMLFSDTEGSTALLRQLGDDYRHLLARQRSLLRVVWQRHGGQEMGTEGDSFFVTFRTAAEGVAAALHAQRAIREEEWTGGVDVRLRIGLHTGEPLAHDEGYVGMDVHRAARIAGVAHGGQVVLSEATRQLVMGRLPHGAGLVTLGPHQLKDLPTAEHLYQLTAPGLDLEFPPLRTVAAEVFELGVLGPLQVLRGGEPVALGGRKQRAILATLILKANRVVSAERLIEAAWGPKGGPKAETALKRHVADLEKVLQPQPGDSSLIARRRHGYELRIDPTSVDMLRFEGLVTEASKLMADDHYDQAVRALNDALRLWRGDPLADLPLDRFRTTVDRLEEARLTAVEDRFEAELGSGQHTQLVAPIESLLDEHPLRERLWGQLMLALYRSGQRADALAAYERAAEALGALSGPGPDLRDLARRIDDQDPDLAGPAGAARPKVKLPVVPHELVGRADDVAALAEQLGDGSARLLTLTGPGGVGKTRLAVEVAAKAVDDYPGGVFFVPLAAVTDAGLVLPAVAAVLEILEQPDEALLQFIAVSLGRQPTLLVLDNLEQVPHAAAVVDDLLGAAPALRVLATSQRALRLGAEREYPVGPLGLPSDPPSAHKLTPDEARGHAAVELFVARARLVRPDFELDDDNAGTVAEICSRLDGVPLAIELAAARLALLSPSQLLDRLGQKLTLLRGGRSDLPDRHRTLRATIDWSYQLLDEGQQQLLARLGAFAGTFSVDSAQVVATTDADPVEDDQDVLEGLLALVECSLVRRLPGPHETRFRLLETVHEYARERLAQAAEETAVRRRLALHLLDRVESAQPGLDGAEAPQVLATLRPEQTNFRAALEWAVDAGEVELAARLATSLRVYWMLEGRLTEGRSWLARILDHQDLSPAHAMQVRLAAGILAYFQDDHGAARPHLETAVELARELGDEEAVAMSLGYLGALMLGAGDAAAAQLMVEETASISSRIGSYQGEVLALSLSAVIAAMSGDVEVERRFYLERLDVARKRGDCRRIAETLGNLADIAVEQGNLDHARTYAGEALKLARGVARMVTRDALLTLGRIELASGRPTSAAESIADALRLSLDLGQRFEVAQALLALGAVASAEGDHQRAARLFGAGDRLHGDTSPLDVDLEPEMAEHLERTRAALGEEAFRVAQVSGAALTLEDVTALALSGSSA